MLLFLSEQKGDSDVGHELFHPISPNQSPVCVCVSVANVSGCVNACTYVCVYECLCMHPYGRVNVFTVCPYACMWVHL